MGKACSTPGCSNPHRAKGLCLKCYNAAGPRRAQMRMYQQRSYKADPEKIRGRGLLSRFGITLAEWWEKFTRQGGVCFICRKPCSDGRRLAVDHDPATLKVRDLLCRRCNTILGQVNESPALLRAMAAYLEGHNAQPFMSPAATVTVLEPLFAEEVFTRCLQVAKELEEQHREPDCIAVLRALGLYLTALQAPQAQVLEVAEHLRRIYVKLRADVSETARVL